jgi:hypothetical protein
MGRYDRWRWGGPPPGWRGYGFGEFAGPRPPQARYGGQAAFRGGPERQDRDRQRQGFGRSPGPYGDDFSPRRGGSGPRRSGDYGFQYFRDPRLERGPFERGSHEEAPGPAWPSGRAQEDQELRSYVRRSMLSDVALDSSGIEIEVEDGVVTLTGRVGDHLQARYAWDDAWDTPGVRGVISRLEVRPAGEEEKQARGRGAEGEGEGAGGRQSGRGQQDQAAEATASSEERSGDEDRFPWDEEAGGEGRGAAE